MLRQWLRILALAALALSSPALAAAVTQVNACGNLTKAGETYVLTADIPFPLGRAACFVLLADRITLDLNGHTITGPGAVFDGQVGIWDNNQARTSTVVKNGSVQAFEIGLLLQLSTRSTVRGVTASGNVVGMAIGPNSLVKDCVVQRNVSPGIVTGNGVQVENCLIGGDDDNGNGGFGLVGGQRMLVTRNTVIGNGNSGILVGMNSTVTHNTSNENGNDGIAVGQKSLVSLNTANDNNGDGIEAVCASTVTNNEASNNAMKLNLIGPGCFEKNNTSPDETGCVTGDGVLAAC